MIQSIGGMGHQQVNATSLIINSKVVMQLFLNFTISMLKSHFHEICKFFLNLIWQEISMSIWIQDMSSIAFKIWELWLNK